VSTPVDRPARVHRIGAIALMALWGTIVAFAILSSTEAKVSLRSALDQIEPAGVETYRWIPIFVVGAAVLAWLLRRWTQVAIAPLATLVLVATSLLGAARASYDNNQVSYPTSASGPSPLVELAATSPNGIISTQWTTFIAAEALIGGDVVVMPAGSADVAGAFEIYFTAMSGASVVEQTYEFNVDPDDPAVSTTPAFDRPINVDWRLTIIGDAERYVVFEAPGRIFMVATP